MSQRYQQVIIILLMFSLLVTGVLAVDGPVITPIPANDTLDIGESTAVAVVMDVAPTGLSGFNVTVSLTEPSVGEITNVTCPDWAILPVNSSLPSDSVYVQAVDLMGSVGAGVVNVTLCTLTVRGDAVGQTGLEINVSKIDDDISGRYKPKTIATSITVTATPTPTPTPITGLLFNPMSLRIQCGDVTQYAVVMDAAPTGLSGFNVTVSLTEPSVGEIINVTYPDWAILPLNSSLPADYVSVQAVELMSLVGPGAANINLCTLTVRGDTAGETNLTFTLMKIEDDVGGRYAPETTDANMIVEDPNVPAANFTANVTSGTVPLEVQFTDMSIGNPISWSWLFGDGTTSPDQYPVHTYNLPGNYTVTLTINDGAGIYTRPKYIKVTPIRFGDANGDDMINQADTLRVMKEVVGLEKKPERGEDLFRKTDIHHNDVIDVGDAMFIAQYNVGLRDVWFEKI